MSGPPYPHPNPPPGSNAIGKFQIGVSPIGTIYPFDIWSTVLTQYANSTTLAKLITNFSAYLDFTKLFDDFFDDIWNIDTAQGIGLDIWGRIVGVSRILQIVVGTNFGFEEAGGDGFNQSAFYSGPGATSNYSLSDSAFRLLILAKALFNISDGSVASTNAILRSLFPGRGNTYVVDNFDMTMTIVFVFQLSPVELAIVENSGVIPRPAGVLLTIQQPTASFIASVSGTTLSVLSLTGTIGIGDVVVMDGVPPGTTILSQLSGPTGGVGDYQLDNSGSSGATAGVTVA